jgi:hypothetical protein
MKRPLLIGFIVGGLALVALIVVGAILVIGAIDRQDALDEHGAAADTLATAVTEVEEAVGEADQVLGLANDPLMAADLVPADAVADLTTERDAAVAALDSAGALSTDPAALATDEVRELSADLVGAAADLGDDDTLVWTALDDLVIATQASALELEAANVEAENRPRLDFRSAVRNLEGVPREDTGEYLFSYLEAAQVLQASHVEEIAEKAGPLFDRRMSVQAFARSIAGGVLLDFDWAPTVNGYGTGGSYGGTSYWQAEAGGYATITLSDSVATMWPGAGVQSLVAHEVGHAILSKCTDLFYPSEFYADEEESWATAWAIGMGFTADGSGESIYGRPPDGLIQLTLQCR